MSTCPRRCNNGKTIFTFSRRPTTFQKAQNSCKQNGTTLARNLDVSSYAALLNCCSAGPSSYWIGLQNVAASKCDNRNSPGFQWIGSRTCSDGSPLNIKASHINNEECMAMTIRSKPSDTNRNVPSARVEPCHNNNIYYICQTAKRNRSPKETTTTTTTKKNTKILILEIESSPAKRITHAFTPITTVRPKHFNNFFSKNCKISADSSWLRVGGFIGGAVGLNVLVFLLLIILFCIEKRKLKKKHTIPLRSNSPGFSRDQADSTTYWWWVVYLNLRFTISNNCLIMLTNNCFNVRFSNYRQTA